MLIRAYAALPDDHDSGPVKHAVVHTLRLLARRIQHLAEEIRDRLNPGGDSQANAALYRIVITRIRMDQRAGEYLDRRLHEGKTKREVVRCIKRYIAREVYQIINRGQPHMRAPLLQTT